MKNMEDRILYSPKVLKEILEEYGFNFTKSLGQNFLIDKNILDGILNNSNINKDDYILEIGPGIGVLTKELAKRAKRVLAIELDKSLDEILKDNLAHTDNVKIHFGDFLKADIENLVKENLTDGEIKVVANLPYYITTPILDKLFNSDLNIKTITVMVQKEMAERIIANSGSKDYSTFSIFSQFYSEPEIVLDVPNTVFMPRPKVDSTVVVFHMKDKIYDIDTDKFFKIVKSSFSMRRKTLLNNLSKALDLKKDLVRNALLEIEIDPGIRAERLEIEDFLAITRKFEEVDDE